MDFGGKWDFPLLLGKRVLDGRNHAAFQQDHQPLAVPVQGAGIAGEASVGLFHRCPVGADIYALGCRDAVIKVKKAEASVEDEIRKFLDSVFKAMKLEVTIDIKVDEDNRNVDVELNGSEMGVLIGKRGQTLDSLQYLTNLAINKQSENYYRVKIDTEDYRKRRRETLENLAKNISFKVKRTKRPVSLEPMNPFERRVIHSALQNDRFVETHSEGDEPYRHVVVTLKK